MRVLVLTAEEGEGRRSVGAALAADLQSRNVEVIVLDAFQEGFSRIVAFFSRLRRTGRLATVVTVSDLGVHPLRAHAGSRSPSGRARVVARRRRARGGARYGPSPGHSRDNARMLEALGLGRSARSPRELAAALAATLADGTGVAVAAAPTAAALILSAVAPV
jgi:hypothetical protein